MSRRIIVPTAQCKVCMLLGRSVSRAFTAGYVAGVHRVSRGDLANENFCVMHAAEVDEALAAYVGKGGAAAT
ncbi:MAG: hypothetical protein JWP87_320 [Labilithrix sp.]|nr:hypothetical protein [Labilithrix sp.]